MFLHDNRMIIIVFIILIILVNIPTISSDHSIGLMRSNPDQRWNDNWLFDQEITIHIDTSQSAALYQPIDLKVEFESKCWALNETIHSIRVCCWHDGSWFELESQIYDLNFSDDTHIISCGLVFLIPSFADGSEQYYVYYHSDETPQSDYPDHVTVKDSYYYFEPITGLSVEGDYYQVCQDDEIVYGVGQKGKVLNRRLSQIAIRMKPGTEKFDILNTDLLTSFSFSYQHGEKDEDEISSDQRLVSKEITIDGNLMVEFVIVSESEDGKLRSSNRYRYYFHPTEKKRIDVHVYHQILEEGIVTGIENGDGRFGTIISFHSKSASMKKMVFGSILPFVHVYGENNRVNEYTIDTNPEGSNRQWPISYEDDCDIGSDPWFSYDEGSAGKTHGILFSSHSNIISNASDERDGIELKAAAKEYLDLVGAEVDYVSISFGRNAFEPFQDHDLIIDKGLEIEFDAAFVTYQNATSADVAEESHLFQQLIKHRHQIDEAITGGQNIHTLTVVPHLTGRFFSFPLLRNATQLPFPVLTAELYQNNTLLASQELQRSPLRFSSFRFPKLSPGDYVVKLYRTFSNTSKKYVGYATTSITQDTAVHVYCTWEKSIRIQLRDQHQRSISGVSFRLFLESNLINEIISNSSTDISVHAPFNLFRWFVVDDIQNLSVRDVFRKSNPYVLKAYYKGFEMFDSSISWVNKPLDLTIPLHDLDIIFTDDTGLAPDVDLKPYLISKEMEFPQEIQARIIEKGRVRFENLPAASYTLHFSYGGFFNTKSIMIPAGTDSLQVLFSHTVKVSFSILNNRGEPITDESITIEVNRDGKTIKNRINPLDTVYLPPGGYAVSVFNEDQHRIGSKTIDIKHEGMVEIVTNQDSLLYIIVTVIAAVVIAELVILVLSKKISINTFLKLGVIAIVIASLVQPWWVLDAVNKDTDDQKTSMMYLFPPKMIDEYRVDDTIYLSQATIPEMFTDFLSMLLWIIYIGLAFMVTSFIPNVFLGKRYAWALSAASILFVSIVAIAFGMGMSRICEISLGSLQGSAILEFMLPTYESVYMNADWGLGPGFYLVIFAAVVSFLAGLIDLFRKKQLFDRIRRKKC